MIPYNFIFDVDGTLTPSRQEIDPVFKTFFKGFIQYNNTWLITGSDYSKTAEQVGADICKEVRGVYNCSGNHIWRDGQEVYKDNWVLPDLCREWFEKKLKKSEFSCRTGQHIEERAGLANFSIVGRGATLGERKMYVTWDEETNERYILAQEFNEKFKKKKLLAQVAGETGIDITQKNSNKSSILRDVSIPIIFFGDKVEPGGNDFPLANALIGKNDSHTIGVNSWSDTYFHLKKIIKDVQKHLNSLQYKNGVKR